MSVVVVRAVKPNDELDVMATKVIKTKKVKPNYKRKLATERDKVKKNMAIKKIRGFPYLFIPLFVGGVINMDRKVLIKVSLNPANLNGKYSLYK